MIDKRRRMIIKEKTKMGFSEAKEGAIVVYCICSTAVAASHGIDL